MYRYIGIYQGNHYKTNSTNNNTFTENVALGLQAVGCSVVGYQQTDAVEHMSASFACPALQNKKTKQTEKKKTHIVMDKINARQMVRLRKCIMTMRRKNKPENKH